MVVLQENKSVGGILGFQLCCCGTHIWKDGGVQVRIRRCLPANQSEQVNPGASKELVMPGM